jgi:hypothetical protein
MKKINSMGIKGLTHLIRACGIKHMAVCGIATLLLSVALIATVLGQQGGQEGMPQGGMSGWTSTADIIFAPAIYINEGEYLAEKSNTTAVSGGKVGKTSASRIKIASKADDFNGIYVKGGKSQYTLSDSTIELSGSGSNSKF